MSISNELSSDVAAALLAENHGADPVETDELMAIVVEVHSTLRELTAGERKERRRFLKSVVVTPPGGNAAAR
jgi:predicted transcriptional regulator